jgi:rhomboid-like protein
MQVLQDLQFRRVTGSLAEQGISFPDDPEVTEEHAGQGLAWLRDKYPVDEEAAAAEWAEEEAAKLEANYTQRAEELWLYKRNDDEPEMEEIQQHDKRGLYGQSVLEQRQKEVSAKKAAEKALKEKEQGDAPPEQNQKQEIIVREKAYLGMFTHPSFMSLPSLTKHR